MLGALCSAFTKFSGVYTYRYSVGLYHRKPGGTQGLDNSSLPHTDLRDLQYALNVVPVISILTEDQSAT